MKPLRPSHPRSRKQVIGQPAAVKHLDLHTCTIKEALGVDPAPFSFTTDVPAKVSGFAGWFDTDFAGKSRTKSDPGLTFNAHFTFHIVHFTHCTLAAPRPCPTLKTMEPPRITPQTMTFAAWSR